MKVIHHIGFWLTVLFVLTAAFGRSYHSVIESFYFVSLLLPVVIATAYFFNYFLVPRYLFKKRYARFILYFFYLLIISLNLEMYVITLAFIVLANYNYANMNPITTDIFVLTLTLYCVVFGLAFVRLVRFYLDKQEKLNEVSDELRKTENKYLVVKENRKNRKISLEEIIYIESLSDYVRFNLDNQRSITSKDKISKLERELPGHFIRIHRSFIINKIKPLSFNSESVQVGEISLPIGRSYRKSVQSALLD